MSAVGNYYFAIVGHHDTPLFEMEFSPTNKEPRKEDHSYLSQFIAHASLDLIDEHIWKNTNMYLKIIDKFNDWFVSAFVTGSQIRFLMLHDTKNEDGIKSFFWEMFEMYIKYSMNPFYNQNTRIISTTFEKKASLYGRKYLVG